MSFVGTRPEAVKYVEKYKPEYMATLLLPAGITKVAGICGYDSISSAAGFFRSDTTIGGGKKETETNAAGIIGYNRCENIEYSKV